MKMLPRSIEDSTITSQQLSQLLRHLGWTVAGSQPGRFEVWTAATGRDVGLVDDEVIVPLDSSRSDYPRLLRNAQAHILSQYGQEASEYIRTLSFAATGALDTTHWRKDNDSELPGLIRWEDGEALFAAARGALSAVARSTREPRFYHGNASAHVAKRFLESAYMGQTEVGSFIITALTPAETRFHLSRASEDARDTPTKTQTVSGRAILQTFLDALTTVRSVLDEFKEVDDLQLFDEGVSNGVSFELLRSLTEVSRGSESAVTVELINTQVTPVAQEFVFKPSESVILERAAIRFAESPAKPQEAILAGDVTLLSRTRGEDIQVVRIDMGGHKVRVRLSSAEYSLALEAAAKDMWLQVTGKVEKDGNAFWMNRPQHVEIVQPVRKQPAADDVPLDDVEVD